MRYSPRFEADFRFYFSNRKKFIFSGAEKKIFPFNLDGVSGKEAFHQYDSCGKILATKHPYLAAILVNTKKSVNLHITIWVEGFEDMCIPIEDYLSNYRFVPDWVPEAFREQLLKYRYNR